jgi:tetratricopeptide (TPR) repeat protein
VAGNRREAQAPFEEGVQAQQERRWIAAIEAFGRAAELDPSLFEAHYNLGLAAYQENLLPQSLTAYENALAVQPESISARYNFALALQKANHPRDAANELEKLIATQPGEPRFHLTLAGLYAEALFEKEKARAHYLKVLEAAPQHPQATAIRFWLAENP